MYSMVLMAALTTGMDMPDIGRRGGRGCHGCYGGCYGSYYGGCYGGGGGCYGGWGGGYGGCYGGGYGGCYGGGWGGGYGGYGRGYGGHVWGGAPVTSGYAYSPMMYGNTLSPGWGNYSSPLVLGNGNFTNPGTTQSFYFNGGQAQGNEATIIVHLPAEATLMFDGQPTQSRSNTRVFHSPPLEPGKTYTYELTAEINRDGRPVQERRHVDVQAGRQTEVTMNFNNAGPNRNPAGLNPGEVDENTTGAPATRTRRTGQGTLPTPPRDR